MHKFRIRLEVMVRVRVRVRVMIHSVISSLAAVFCRKNSRRHLSVSLSVI
mgnify:CR=1 FL=1